MTQTNAIAARIERIKAGAEPQLLAKMSSGYAILSDQQPEPITGCCMLLPDPTPAHLTDLSLQERSCFLLDLSLLGDAVVEATGCERLNYLMLCNQAPQLHGHVMPRFAAEDPASRLMDPFAAYDFPNARCADVAAVDRELHAKLKAALEARLKAAVSELS